MKSFSVGCNVVGRLVGAFLGFEVGMFVVGIFVVGRFVGFGVGALVGFFVGIFVGNIVGLVVSSEIKETVVFDDTRF